MLLFYWSFIDTDLIRDLSIDLKAESGREVNQPSGSVQICGDLFRW